MLEKKAVTGVPIHDLLASRWSPRAYAAGKPVSREQLAALLEAGRWAPSCNGDEPWRYLVWDRSRDPQGWQQAFECLSEGNRKWVKNVPLLMLSCAGSIFAHNGKPNRWAQHDTGAASLSIALQAVALGLIAHQMGGFDADKARAAFSIPADYTPMSMIAIGYQAEPDVLDEETRKKELAPRKRKLLSECFFECHWGKPIQP
ncbi:MAG: nitroreductase family protein [Burkholderiales bacterium]|nr:nitroreductase family protein [Burkholderiales bacterium]